MTPPTASRDLRGAGPRKALIVAAGRYRHDGLPDLGSPAKDAELAKRVLGNADLCGFDSVDVMLDPDCRSVTNRLYDFFTSAGDDDFLFVYFSVHGRKDFDNDYLFLAMSDTDPDRLPPTAVRADYVRDVMDNSRAKRAVVVLDCCFAGAFRGDPRQRQDRERVLILSASAVQHAHEGGPTPGGSRPSAFAGAFFEGIESGRADSDDNAWVTVREAFDYAVAQLRESDRDQSPQMRTGVSGDLVLSRAPQRHGSLPSNIAVLLRHSLPAARRAAVEELGDWLNSGDAAKVRLAEDNLGELRSDTDERVAQAASQMLAHRYRGRMTAGQVEPVATQLSDDPLWFKKTVFYEVRVRSYADTRGDGVGDLQGLINRLDYLQWLGVGCLVLSPIFDSPMEDDGFDIRDFTAIHEDLGGRADLLELIDAAHRRGIRVILDMVLNHTSREHAWFQESRADPDGTYGDFYVWQDTDELYSDGVGTPQSHWTFDRTRRQYYWHRFDSCEPDLNFDSPAVQDAMLEALRFWLDLGIDGYRLLTAPYLYERDGTACEGLTETHTFLQRVRTTLHRSHPQALVMAWADRWPADVMVYFGGTEFGPECDVVQYSSIMPPILLAMRKEDHAPLSEVLAATPKIPEACQWGIMLRNGDEMSLDRVDPSDRESLLSGYAPTPRMRTPAGIRRRLAPLLDGNLDQLQLCMALLLSLPGAPVIYYGDEIGLGENLMLAGTAAIRTPMHWSNNRGADFSSADPEQMPIPVLLSPVYGYPATNVAAQLRNPSSLLRTVHRLIEVRRNSSALTDGDFELVSTGNQAMLAYLRAAPDEQALCLINVSRYPQAANLDLARLEGHRLTELTGLSQFPAIGADPYQLSLTGYGYFWFRLTPPGD